MNKFDMDNDKERVIENTSNRNNLSISRVKLILFILLAVAVAGVAVVITYFAVSGDSSCDTIDKCKDVACNHLQEFNGICQATDMPHHSSVVPPIPINFRLPDNLKPTLYEIVIKPFIGTPALYQSRSFTFEGFIKIFFTCLIPTNKIVIHIKNLNIQNNTIQMTHNDDNLEVDHNWAHDSLREFMTLNLNHECTINHEYSLEMFYNGIISDALSGFYKSSYKQESTGDEIHYLATTHFQPTDARKAFPCFDEPGLKAKFHLKIHRHRTHFTNSLSNAPLHTTVVDPADSEWDIDDFEVTVPMSTYLVAFVVSNFEKITTISALHGITVEVAARPDAIHAGSGKYALDEAAIYLDFFTEYFNVKYPLVKSTQVAVPDFNAGAMENWGCVIYRESALLYNVATDTIANKRRVSVVVSHELAHQWFGDLVTPLWWNDIWLNEGFASWVEYLGYNHTHPEWKDLDFFFVQKLGTMVLDSLTSSHPISVEVNDPSEINSIFDTISYNKGSSIIRMMNAFLTENSFKAGVSKYLTKYEFSNAIQDNLWEELTSQAHEDSILPADLTVKDIMDTWTLKMGYPVVQVTRDPINQHISTSQQWFLLNPEIPVDHAVKWFVPFTYTTKKESNFDFESETYWMKPSEPLTVIQLTVRDPHFEQNDWILANLKHSGFYRVNYDQVTWNLLIEQLNENHLAIDSTSRAQLLDDSFNLGRSEMIDQLTFLNVVKYLKNEQDSLPFAGSSDGLHYIGNMLSTNYLSFKNYKTFYIGLLNATYQRLHWNEHLVDVTELDLQLSTISVMCSYGVKDCIDKCHEFYNNWKNNQIMIPNDFKNVVYRTVIQYGTEDEWNFLYETAKHTTSTAEQLRMFRGLTATTNMNLLKFLLEKLADETVIRRQDETTMISAVAGNSLGRTLVWDYVVENWEGLMSRYGGVSFTLGSLVTNVLSKFNTKLELQKVEYFMSQNSDLGVAKDAFNQAVENIRLNIRWMEKNLKPIDVWLTDANNDIRQ